jgi:peptide/nickel transport system substrate-binding protein
VDYNNYPTGNLTVAAKYMKLAGYPSGRYTGSATIKVVGANGDPAGPQAAIVNQALQSLGFKTNFNTVEDATMYSKYCGVAAAKIDVCPSVGWIRDWADPQTVLDTPFAGYNIVASNNSNWSLANYQDWPKAAGGTYTGGPLTPIDQAMRAGEKTVGTQARAVAWAKIDRMLVDQAVAVPTYFVIEPEIQSRDVRGINQLWNQGSWDYSFTSLK